MEEFNIEVQCPRCEGENYETASFNFDSADSGGCNSHLMRVECGHCEKEFWFSARVNFEVEVTDWFKKKPKKVKS